jgi:hypothetical protein
MSARLLDELDTRFGAMTDFSATVLELEAVLPPLEESFETAMPDVADLSPPTRPEVFSAATGSAQTSCMTISSKASLSGQGFC